MMENNPNMLSLRMRTFGSRRLLEMQLNSIQCMRELGKPLVSGESFDDAEARILTALDLMDTEENARA